MKNIFSNKYRSVYGLLFMTILLFSLSYIFNNIYSNNTSLKREAGLLEKYINSYQEKFDRLVADTELVQKLITGNVSQHEIAGLVDDRFGVYLFYENEGGGAEFKFWSNQLAAPRQIEDVDTSHETFLTLSNGFYVQLRKTVILPRLKRNVRAYCLISVASKYFIETDYLPEQFYYSRSAGKKVAISDANSGMAIKSVSGKELFWLTLKSSGTIPYNNWVTIILRLGGLFFLLLFFHFLSDKIARNTGPWYGIATLALLVIITRVIIYLLPGIFNFRQFELFDPGIYGSTGLLRSLGDLLLNTLLLCWVMVFAWSQTKNKEPIFHLGAAGKKWLAGIISLLGLILSTFFIASVIRSLVADSKISFDVTNFFSLDIYSVFGFMALAGLSLAYYYLTQILFRILFSVFKNQQTLTIYFALAFTGLIYLTIKFGDPSVLFYLPVLAWLLCYTWIVQKQGLLQSRFHFNIAGILFWIFVFSLSISAVLLSENRKVEWERRKVYADKLAVQADPSSERLMNIALQYMDDDFLTANFRRFQDEENGRKMRDSILNENYRGYLNKFETRLYVFDADGKPVYNNDVLDFESLNIIFTQQSDTTKVPDLRYYETSFDKFKFLTKRTIREPGGRLMGYLFIISDPKKHSSEALFPELFKQTRKSDPESSPIYSYAVYSDRQLVSPSNKYQFATTLSDNELPENEFEKRKKGDFEELWYRAGNNKVVVMARKRESWIEIISLFSYLFCAFLLLVSAVQAISFILSTGLKWKKVKERLQFNIRTQIHNTVIFVSLLSFIIIGFATISFFKERYFRNNSDKLSRTMRIMVNEMQKKQADLSVFDDVIKVYDSVSLQKLQVLVDDISDIHDIDVNVYDMEGNLQVSSQVNVYSKGVLSKKMHPVAYYELHKKRLVHYVQEEQIGQLTYLSIYAPVRDDEGKVYSYLNIPYFALERELNQDISNFLVTIINLNAFIFLIAGVIALFVTNRITNSFAVISDKMREVSLGGRNEEITWNRKDEIGDLVKEYNKMVNKLGESATTLAKSEREGAWREMARQVAHEIKNPLTPMKLSIQYLQKAIDSNQPNVKELSTNVAKTLVEQIDHLSKIAFDFSQFANIGNTNDESFDLHEVLASLKDLYASDPRIDFYWHPVHEKIILQADRTQMNRLFTNLFTNAVEACNGKSKCRLTVDEIKRNGSIRISITDNGEGIPDEMQSKIFVPNFTTKTSGTGLGLAMCKGIAEHAKGKIWFDTEVGKGTTFHVELPVLN